MGKKIGREALEIKVKKLSSKVRRLQRELREIKSRDDAKYGPDGRLRPHYDGEFA